MHWASIVILLVIMLWVFPAAVRETTALALLTAWGAAELFTQATGNNLPIGLYRLLDTLAMVVIAILVALGRATRRDWFVLAIFPLMWGVYFADPPETPKWWLLWMLALVQFLIAGRLVHTLRCWSNLHELAGSAFAASPLSGNYRRSLRPDLRPHQDHHAPAQGAPDGSDFRTDREVERSLWRKLR